MLQFFQGARARYWLTFLGRGWDIYAHTAGILVIASCIALLIVALFSSNKSALEHHPTIPPRLLTPVVGRGDQIVYVVHTRQNQSCPGDIVTVFTSLSPRHVDQLKFPAVITARRPITQLDVGIYRDVPVSMDPPEDLWPGKWRVIVAADSRCPISAFSSKLAEFALEVKP